jgi:hypothetical protein
MTEDRETKFVKACPESAKILEKSNNPPNATLGIEDVLTSPFYQRGAGYRAEKLKAIWLARQQGKPEREIVKLLLRGGLTKQTANIMMQDSREAYE